jgi:hypothetical protein
MATAVLAKPGTESAHHLRDIVEQSIAVLCERDEAAAKQAQVRASRFLPLHADRASMQKAALTNAAKALASLWNVSRPGRAKHSRGLQYGQYGSPTV